MQNTINWFEIPASDIGRTSKFYSSIFNIEIKHTEMMGMKMGFFPSDGENVSGALVQGEDYTPSTQGSLLYLNGGNDLQPVLSKVDSAGGKVIVPKTHIGPEFGYFAIFIDTEGNRIALHSIS